MTGFRQWVGTAAIAAAITPAALAEGPPSARVDRWYQKYCPRDLTPQVFGPSYGYFETRWRIPPEEGQVVPPPTVLPPTKPPEPPKAKVEPPKAKTVSKPATVIPAKATKAAPEAPKPSPYSAGPARPTGGR